MIVSISTSNYIFIRARIKVPKALTCKGCDHLIIIDTLLSHCTGFPTQKWRTRNIRNYRPCTLCKESRIRADTAIKIIKEQKPK